MKKFGILALVLAFTMMLSVVSFAAEPAFKVVERDDAAYDPDVTKVTPGSGNIVVSTDATEGAYYGVLLVNGVLPTVDDAGNNNILYINQETAGNSGTVSFDVLPIMPADNLEAPLTLYISSNAADLITVPVAYGTEAPAGPAVKFMNGAETVAAELEVDTDGNVTLPAATFNKTANDGYTFTHYSWVNADETVEYLAGTKAAATALENVTLYAKYKVNISHGDMDASGAIDETDRTYVHQYITRNRVLGNVTKTFATVVGVDGMPEFTVGDVDGGNSIDETDRTYIHQYITRNRALGNIGKDVYYVNK